MTVFVNIDFDGAGSNTSNMPPKKKAGRAAHPPPQPPAVSDYDTDTANLTDNNIIDSIPAPPPGRSNEQLNYMVLRRWIPNLESILAIAPFAVLYNFSPETEQWDKCPTQGSLFVLQLTADPYPRYQVVILNRMNMENLQLDVASTDDIEVTNEFIIITTPDEERGTVQVQGIWIYSAGDIPTENSREAIAQTVMECAQKAEQYAQDFGPQDDGACDGAQEQDGRELGVGAEIPIQQAEPAGLEQMPQEHKLDLATLFGKPQLQQQGPTFPPNADTDFFRNPTGPLAQTQQFGTPVVQQPPNTQQNALLDLFKNAKRG
ncbi:mRNA-decapping enzyme 1A [Fulvia fulva]|uniref:mRNA-decapping enzyme 1A n=1 Tax=Passalora fulva TaxID=5499 RepID=A0A9Q8P9V8_PASFU|nr:mRNA-decapping enzyme 1A [Fulvia fulva]KAK4621713.1 mRNA-decapping enzyme 1A [Fulvia fulva]KAK4622797.1 mRNA-decapping enzyme 1A [Fulvia fulva]UJO18496.1 mRNA-decapping enzyme 1A [Fulvia fulva]WPV16031.1 mRNA-decapping enzyme 1A [Fulvia fulva]WPV31085.1 mRNA-decapping enzyme 1A [Fulvia fulva]